jgi:hypothetical protein
MAQADYVVWRDSVLVIPLLAPRGHKNRFQFCRERGARRRGRSLDATVGSGGRAKAVILENF